MSEPRDGLPLLITQVAQLADAAKKLAGGTGPVALDAERASGFKYSGRAYLVQLRRAGSGSFLIDPIQFADLVPIQEALTGVDWILHAASQDLVCLRELGLTPTAALYDTELAGRLLGLERVGLGPLVLAELGFALAKEHSAADWSTRPLPEQWLNYAALDVEFLLELWAKLEVQLVTEKKYEAAIQEFNFVRDNTNPIVRPEAWRRTSGLHAARSARALAIVRSLWHTRDRIAKSEDIASGRILPDSILVSIAQEAAQSDVDVPNLESLAGRLTRRNRQKWISAVEQALALAETELPETRVKSTAPPPPRTWQDRNPKAWAQLEQVRHVIASLSEQLSIPVENLITPDTVRRIIWTPPQSEEQLAQELTKFGVRPWQRELIEPALKQALFEPLISTEPQRVAEQ
ncbi:MAG: ribonuclease D [Actinobacteria bacterium]|nr:ribonuclease D [Actinomycetota bacterium]